MTNGIGRQVREPLSRLGDFSGRDTRRDFWPYTGVVIAVGMVLQSVGFVAVFAWSAASRDVDEAQGFTANVIVVAIVLGLAVALLASAGSRRLHDRGRTGWWGAVPAGFLAVSLVLYLLVGRQVEADPEPGPGLFLVAFVATAAYMVSLALLVVQLASEGAEGENRYGPPPSGAAG